MTLIAKLAEVMGEIERVPKHGRNEFHKYDYATEGDIVAAVRQAMAKRALMLVPDVTEMSWRETGGKSPICTLRVRFTVLDGESPDTLSFIMPGEGQDSGDKAVYKAMTGATKYALLKLFLIPTGDDPEREDAAPARRGRVHVLKGPNNASAGMPRPAEDPETFREEAEELLPDYEVPAAPTDLEERAQLILKAQDIIRGKGIARVRVARLKQNWLGDENADPNRADLNGLRALVRDLEAIT